MAIRRIPIKHYDTVIGSAVIDDKGIMTVVLDHPASQDFGKDLVRLIDVGRITGLSISPIMPPSEAYNTLQDDGFQIDKPFKDRISPNVKPIRF
jgi:hypothetical protein